MLPDGSLVTTAFRAAAGAPRFWREVEPLVWEDVADPQSHLSAVIKNGQVLRMSAGNAAAVAMMKAVAILRAVLQAMSHSPEKSRLA